MRVTDTASGKLAEMEGRLIDLTPLMEKFGRHMLVSVRSNFVQGGRPAWEPLKGVTVLPKGSRKKNARVEGRARMGGPLVLTGDLKDSPGFTAEKDDLVLWAKPDPLVKGPVHQFGTEKAGVDGTTVIPERPFLVFQAEDLAWFRASCAGWIRVGRTS